MLDASATIFQDSPSTLPDLGALKASQRKAWSSGDYAVIGTTLQIVSEQLCESLDLRSGEWVLDVATGNGNTALAAARRWCDVVAIDFVPALLNRGRDRADAQGLDIDFREADAEALPFPDGSFDVVASTFGAMYVADQERAAAEMIRTCRRGGRIGLASWTPDGFVGQVFGTITRYLPPPPGAGSPTRWGTEDRLAELFGPHASSITSTKKRFVFRYRSPEHWLDIFKIYYGPLFRAFAALAPMAQAALDRDLLGLFERHNFAEDGSAAVPGEYLETVMTRA